MLPFYLFRLLCSYFPTHSVVEQILRRYGEWRVAVMCTWKCVVVFLLLALTATAQQTNRPSPSPPQTPTPQPGAYSPPATPPQAAMQTVGTPPTSTPPVTMDQVVDRAIEREHALMEMLKSRTPVVETYLQNLKFDPQNGSTPVQDHYFLGRMDFRENVAHRDFY